MIRAKRLALKMAPPTVVLEYTDARGRVHVRRMPVRGLHDANAGPREVAAAMARAHPAHLGASVVPRAQLERLVSRLLGTAVHEGFEQGYNHLDDEALAREKARMDALFEANRVAAGDPAFVYDLRKEFAAGDEACDWDDDEGDGEI